MNRYYFGSAMNVIGSGIATSIIMGTLTPFLCSTAFALGICAVWIFSSAVNHD